MQLYHYLHQPDLVKIQRFAAKALDYVYFRTESSSQY